MNNQERINIFLNYWAKIGIQNPNYSFADEGAINRIYHELIFQGVSLEDRKVSLQSSFEYWIDYYKDNPGIDVFNTLSWPYFCQFISKDKTARNLEEHIKVYIPLDSQHIVEGAKLIFNFLTENHISHISKIGKQIRFDDIVVRLTNEIDAEKLAHFIKENAYLQEGLLQPNPFAFQKDGIAMACDGRESFNFTVASIVAIYLDDCKKRNTLSSVSYDNFYQFVKENYQKEFLFQESNLFREQLNYHDDKEKLNFQYIISLMIKNQNPRFGYQDFVNHFHHSLDDKQEKKIIKEADEELFQEVLSTMTKKYIFAA